MTAEEVVTEVAVEEVAVDEVVSMSITPHRQILTSSHTNINIMTCKRLGSNCVCYIGGFGPDGLTGMVLRG